MVDNEAQPTNFRLNSSEPLITTDSSRTGTTSTSAAVQPAPAAAAPASSGNKKADAIRNARLASLGKKNVDVNNKNPCSVCTYENEVGADKCTMCNHEFKSALLM